MNSIGTAGYLLGDDDGRRGSRTELAPCRDGDSTSSWSRLHPPGVGRRPLHDYARGRGVSTRRCRILPRGAGLMPGDSRSSHTKLAAPRPGPLGEATEATSTLLRSGTGQRVAQTLTHCIIALLRAPSRRSRPPRPACGGAGARGTNRRAQAPPACRHRMRRDRVARGRRKVRRRYPRRNPITPWSWRCPFCAITALSELVAWRRRCGVDDASPRFHGSVCLELIGPRLAQRPAGRGLAPI